MLYINKLNMLIFLYFLFILILSPITILHLDSYYYWDWSRHLAMSYYDGPPMIAYFIKASTLILGDTPFAVHFIGLLTTAVCCILLYKTARLFLEKKSSYIALLLFIFSPVTTLDLIHQTTYDTTQALFWIATLYFFIKHLKFQQIKDLYFTAVSIGFLLLSKYTGIILVIALIIFLIISPYRKLFKSKHFYFSCILIILLFSPVLYWNYSHDWQSFIYQLKTHQILKSTSPTINILTALYKQFLPVLNFLLIAPVICLIKKHYKESNIILFCLVVSLTVFFFYLCSASNNTIKPMWLAPYLNSTVLLAAYYYQQKYYQSSTKVLILVYFIISIVIVLHNNTWINYTKSQKIATYHLIKQFESDYPKRPNLLLTSNWMSARSFFFWQIPPYVYSLNCDLPENQYALWSEDIKKQIMNKTIKDALFIDFYKQKKCLKRYFDFCKRLPTRNYSYGETAYHLYAYHCTNN